MSEFHYHQNVLHVEQVSLTKVAEEYGTPCYVYSMAEIRKKWQEFQAAFLNFPHQICYAVKANSNITILKLLASWGAGFDIVSIGELERVIAAGGDPQKIIFSGVGKQVAEIEQAIQRNIFCFNIESEHELFRVAALAKKFNKTINIVLRINPDIEADTHPYIATGLVENKFGIASQEIPSLCKKIRMLSQVKLIGVASHIGSQITKLEPFTASLNNLVTIYQQLNNQGFDIRYINIGGGLGVRYQNETPPTIMSYANAIKKIIQDTNITLLLEPGRALVAEAGVLLTQIEYLKITAHKRFAIVDAGMNDIMRPALYQAWQPIQPVVINALPKQIYDVVGPVCESADFLGKDRELAVNQGDLLAIMQAGAYGFSMSSQYNSRCRPAEIIVNGSAIHLIRQRDTIPDLFKNEILMNEF